MREDGNKSQLNDKGIRKVSQVKNLRERERLGKSAESYEKVTGGEDLTFISPIERENRHTNKTDCACTDKVMKRESQQAAARQRKPCFGGRKGKDEGKVKEVVLWKVRVVKVYLHQTG